MSTLDSNVWYLLSFGNRGNAPLLVAQDVKPSGTGTVLVVARELYDGLAPSYHWQVVKLREPNTYVLRTRLSGPTWFLGTFWAPNSTTSSSIRTENYGSPNVTSQGAQWLIEPANYDGTNLYYLSTVVNGTGQRLDLMGLTGYLRDASAASNTSTERWAFASAGVINNATWSVTASSTLVSATATATFSPQGSGSPAQDSGSSTSTGAIAGGVVGGVAVLLLFLGVILCYRRRRKSAHTRPESKYSAVPPYKSPNELDASPRIFSERYSTAVNVKPGLYEKPSPSQDEMFQSQPQRTFDEVIELPVQEYKTDRTLDRANGTFTAPHPR